MHTLYSQVLNNFGASKRELNLQFRLGLEYALARADFLNVPDIVVVQALVVFLSLVRRHDSPRFVWMMVGLAIRLAQSLGLHRDGSAFRRHLSPYEVEMRRRVWWTICMLDVRASEDQGTEYTIPAGSFDTRIPLNIDDADISPGVGVREEETPAPAERQSLTDMSFAVDVFRICDLTRRIMSPGDRARAPALEEQVRLVAELYTTFEQGYLRYTSSAEDDSSSIARWVGATCVRLTMSKMTLMIHLPVLSSSSSSSAEVRDKLLVAAIEVAEYNHALNAEPAGRRWRWMYQTYTHWHAVVLLLIEIARRPSWTPLVERAWVALHSRWLIPAQPQPDGGRRRSSRQIWIPLRRLMARARARRDAELRRLRDAVEEERAGLDRADRHVPAPASPGLFPSEESFRRYWRGLVGLEGGGGAPGEEGEVEVEAALSARQPAPHLLGDVARSSITASSSSSSSRTEGAAVAQRQHIDTLHPYDERHGFLARTARAGPLYGSPGGTLVAGRQTQSRPSSDGNVDRQPVETMGSVPWIWADEDPAADVFGDEDVNMDLDNEADWLSWLESAKNMELNPGGIPHAGNGWASLPQ